MLYLGSSVGANYFVIDSISGLISVVSSLDYETLPQATLEVVATDGGSLSVS